MHPRLPPRSTFKPSQVGLRDPSTELSSQSTISDPFSIISKSSSFQMMDITISVDVMDGLVMEVKKMSGEPSLGTTPINAVISAMKNVSSSRQIATHVPSLPLSLPSNNFSGKVHNLFVRWPTDFDPHGDALSTFKFSRLMKKSPVLTESCSLSHLSFEPENIELAIGLMRGSEIITLGKANISIQGDEFEEMTVDIPICTAKDVVTSKKIREPSPMRGSTDGNQSKKATKTLKPLSFSRDSKRKFYLNDHAMVRLHVKAVPQVGPGEDEYDNPVKYTIKPTITASITTDSSIVSSKNSDELASVSKEDYAPSFSLDENHNRSMYEQNSYHEMEQVDGLRNQLSQVRLNHDDRRQSLSRGMASYNRESRHSSNMRARSSSRHQDIGDDYPTYEHTQYPAPQANDYIHGDMTRSKSAQRGRNHREDNWYSNEKYDSDRGGKHYRTGRSHASNRRQTDGRSKREATRSRAASKTSKRDASPMSLVYDILTGSDIDVAPSSKSRTRSRSRRLSRDGRESNENAPRRPPTSHRTMMV